MATAEMTDAEVVLPQAALAPRSVPVIEEMRDIDGDQRIHIPGMTWEAYVAFNDAVPEGSAVHMIFVDGRLTLLGKSRKHDWFSELLGALVQALANRLEISWEVAGQATYRLAEKSAGIEGDKTYYFREHAVQMLGPVNIDLNTQPPPDLAIEVEVSNPANASLKAWGVLGVPEVWRFNPIRKSFGIWIRQPDGTYSESPTSLALPGLTSAELLGQMHKAVELGSSTWFKQLDPWAEAIVRGSQQT
jgi:Uma2 family endonuclease